MLLLSLAHASYLLAPAPARLSTAHQSWTPRARVLLSDNTEREAKAAATAAANAEARLRTMVREMAQAEEALQQQYVELKMQYAGATERLRVRDEQLEDLQAEVNAVKMLADEDVAAAQAELREQVERVAAGGAEGDATGDAAGGGEAELRVQVSSLEAELRLSKAQADRALADVADLQAELDATRVLAGEEVAAARAAETELIERARKAEGPGGAGGAGSAAAAARSAELEAQVADLLELLEAQQDTADALLLLRPQAARAIELERELVEARRQLRAAGIGEEQEGGGES